MRRNDLTMERTRSGSANEYLLIAGCAATVAIALGLATQRHKTVRLDRAVRKAVRLKRGPRVVALAKSVSFPAAPRSHTAVAVASSAAIGAVTGRLTVAPVVASLLAFAIDRGTRVFVDQLRPPFARKRTGLDRYGFPSGHAAAGTAVAFATAMEAVRGSAPRTKATAYLAAGVCSAAIGWSRIALDEHWVDDVMGGWAIGVAIASIAVVACDTTEAP
jgi:membrane-associated phospholipid phosphatase